MAPLPWLELRAVLLAWLADALPPKKPLRVGVRLDREDASMLVYKLTLPPPGAPDVVSRTLMFNVNGTITPTPAVDGMELRLNEGDEVILTLVDTDDAGNASQESDPLEFTASDTLPPPKPGQLGVALDREE